MRFHRSAGQAGERERGDVPSNGRFGRQKEAGENRTAGPLIDAHVPPLSPRKPRTSESDQRRRQRRHPALSGDASVLIHSHQMYLMITKVMCRTGCGCLSHRHLVRSDLHESARVDHDRPGPVDSAPKLEENVPHGRQAQGRQA